MTKGWAVIAAAVVLAVVPYTSASATPAPLPTESFLYQTRNVDLAVVAASPYRIVILDPTRDGSPTGDWTPQEIADLKAAGKIALAVVRIGEADSSRYYWDPAWVDPEASTAPPSWLGPEDSDRPGIYRVRYWDPAWQQILFGSPSAYVDRILAQGFDGIVLEAVNAYQYWGPDGKLSRMQRNDDAASEMIQLVGGIATYARVASGNADFFVVAQNGATLAGDDSYIANLSGIVAETTWFVSDKRQKSRQTRTVVPYLDRILAAGVPVFALEYPVADRNIDTAYDRAESKGYVPLATTPEHDILPDLPGHPPDATATFVAQAPDPNADVYPDTIPTFTWSDSASGSISYRISFSGNDSRQQVFTFPKRGILAVKSFTPGNSDWRGILRQAQLNKSGSVYWWITSQAASGVVHSSRARTLYRMHAGVPTTVFFVGAAPGQTNGEDRSYSAWDSDWVAHFGGVDDPAVRSQDPLHPFWPDFTPLENPFYVSLPYDDFTDLGLRRPNFATTVPWAFFREYGPLESAVKNRWVKLVRGDQTCYAQWEDVGPFQSYDFRYVFGTSKPRNTQNLGAGMEISPALRVCVGIDSIGITNWRFVFDDEVVPDGPWSQIVTTSQIDPPH